MKNPVASHGGFDLKGLKVFVMMSVPQGTTENLSTSQAEGKRDALGERRLVTIYVMGKAYECQPRR